MDSRPLSTENRTYASNTSNSVKIATPELLNFSDNTLSEDVMTDLIFEDIGGQEIISIVRNDIINGQDVSGQPVKNLSDIAYQYRSENIIPLSRTDKDYFKNFAISIYNKIPECGSGYYVFTAPGEPQLSIATCEYVYVDPNTGDIVIDLINLKPEEQVEVQIISNIKELHDTIYSEESS
jgi:hypothetical protein